jgi:hypothetical protein
MTDPRTVLRDLIAQRLADTLGRPQSLVLAADCEQLADAVVDLFVDVRDVWVVGGDEDYDDEDEARRRAYGFLRLERYSVLTTPAVDVEQETPGGGPRPGPAADTSPGVRPDEGEAARGTASPAGDSWYCGAFQPPNPPLQPYRCTLPAGHTPQHRAVISGEVVAQWPRTGSPS